MSTQQSDILQGLLVHLSKYLTRDQMQVWGKNLAFRWNAAGEIEVPVPNEFTRMRFEAVLRSPIEKAAAELAGRPISVKFIITPGLKFEECSDDDNKSVTNGPAVVENSARQEQVAARTSPFEASSFETFVQTESNKIAYNACMAVAENPGVPEFRMLSIYSPPGNGKTHLLQATEHAVRARFTGTGVLYVPAEKFLNEFVQAIQGKSMDLFKKRYEEIKVLLVDDVNQLREKESTQAEICSIMNNVIKNEGQIIFSFDQVPRNLQLHERVTSRIMGGFIARINPPSYEDAIAIIRRKLEWYNLSLPDDVIDYVASTFKRSVREIEGSLRTIFGTAKMMRPERITLTHVREWLRDTEPMATTVSYGRNPADVLNMVCTVVAKHFKLLPADIISGKRTHDVAQARHIAIYLFSRATGMSMREVAHYFKLGSHSIVHESIKRVEKIRKNDARISSIIERFLQEMS